MGIDDLFKGRHLDREIIILCVRWYLRYRLNFRDLVEMMAERGLSLAHRTLMRWIQRYAREFKKRWNGFAHRPATRGASMRPTRPAAREVLEQHGGARTKIRFSKYLNNLIEQDHRSIMLRLGPMLGLKRFQITSITIAGIELMNRIRKGQFRLGTLRIKENRAPENWNAVLAA